LFTITTMGENKQIIWDTPWGTDWAFAITWCWWRGKSVSSIQQV
jgi:hypothetical protein